MGGLAIWNFLLNIVVLYIIVMISLRIMGKREIGQLSVFDFVVSVMLAELSTLPMEDTNVPIYRSVLAIATLVALQLLVAIMSLRSHRFRHLVEGHASVLVEHGRIQDTEMKRTRYSMHDLIMQLREKGVASVDDVELAVLETSGKLSVLPRPDARPVTPGDLGIPAKKDGLPLPLIVDGQPVHKSLQILRRDETWLQSEVERMGYGTIADVFFATIDGRGQVWMDALEHRDR